MAGMRVPIELDKAGATADLNDWLSKESQAAQITARIDLGSVPEHLDVKADVELQGIPEEVDLKAKADLSDLPSDLPLKVDPDLSSVPKELDLKGNVDLSGLPAEVPLKADVELAGLPREIDIPGKVDLEGLPSSVEIPASLTGLPDEVDVKAVAELTGLPSEVDLPATITGLPEELILPAMVDLGPAPEVDVAVNVDTSQIPEEIAIPVVAEDAAARAELEQLWQDAEDKFSGGVQLPVSASTEGARDALGRFTKGASDGMGKAGKEGGEGLASGVKDGTQQAEVAVEELDKSFAEKVASMSKRDWGRSIKAIKLAVDTVLPALGALSDSTQKSVDDVLSLTMAGAKLGGPYGAAAGLIGGVVVDAFASAKASAKSLSDEIKTTDETVAKLREETVSLDKMDLSHAVAAVKALTTEQARLEASLAATRQAREADREAIGDDDLGPSLEAGATLQKYIELLKSEHTSVVLVSATMDELHRRTDLASESLGDVLDHLDGLGKKKGVKELKADFDEAKAEAEDAKAGADELKKILDSPLGTSGGFVGEWVRQLAEILPDTKEAEAKLKAADSALGAAQDAAEAKALAAFKAEAAHAEMLLAGWASVRHERERLTQAAGDQEKALREQAISDGKAFEAVYQSLAKSLSPEIAEEYGQAIVDAFSQGDAAVQKVADDAKLSEEIYLRGIGMRAAAEKNYNDLYLELQQERIGFDEAEAEAQSTVLKEKVAEASDLAASYTAAMQPLAQVTGAIFNAVAENVAKGDRALKGIGTTAKAAISDVLKSYARKWGLEALTDVGYGLAALATGPIGGISAGLFFEAAGLLGGAALAAGGAGIAIGKGTSASAGSSSSAGSSGSGGGFSGGPGASQGGQPFSTDVQAPMIVNVYALPLGVATERELALIGGRVNAAQAAHKGNGGFSFAGAEG